MLDVGAAGVLDIARVQGDPERLVQRPLAAAGSPRDHWDAPMFVSACEIIAGSPASRASAAARSP